MVVYEHGQKIIGSAIAGNYNVHFTSNIIEARKNAGKPSPGNKPISCRFKGAHFVATPYWSSWTGMKACYLHTRHAGGRKKLQSLSKEAMFVTMKKTLVVE